MTTVESPTLCAALVERASRWPTSVILTFVAADGTVLDIGPGDIGVLPPGARTTWTIHEDLRKVYVIKA